MGIKCSLLGHRFGDVEVQEEREKRGREVVTTVTEVETCERCGTTRVVSENKEVTTVEAPDGTAGEAAGGSTAPDAEADATAPSGGGTSGVDDGDGAGAGAGAEDETGRDSPPIEEAEPGGVTEESVDADADDAVIIDEEESDGREPGEWPGKSEGEPDADADAEGDWPEESGDAAPPDPDAVAWPEEESAGSDAEGGRAVGGEWPEETRREEDDPPDFDLIETRDDVDPAGTASVTVPEGRFRCPECGYTTPVESSSLRAGDFCPECRRGNLVHEADDA